jgi:hypothetical protein
MKRLALEVETATGVPSAAGTTARPAPGELDAEVGGTDDPVATPRGRADLCAAPDVVAERERVGSRGEQPLGEARGQAGPVRRILRR